ncbi:DUF4453 domain-containing protein [Sedimentitalea nanhaiensis]|uniref:YARHG domain-containing protein n=1 Tax=Sedimentitalea nanhaiensis TaxID=999627 RepID=A0A1I6YHE4_9RHOB|nr:DUF4453 domain-containing protein [Sedimentitalea nanhaiensis]SFT49818.1 YARHG domain-containing protein [Sedimentitalea nanhaiensis]
MLVPVTPVLADGACDDLWMTRNHVMDRAGYCFGSVLGQTVFDNSDCTGRQVELSPSETDIVQKVQALEARIGCRVDTNRTWLDLPDINFRKVLTSLPVLDELPGKCIGWSGPETPLYAGHQEPFQVIGKIMPGDDVGYNHLSVADWTYVTTHVPYGEAMKSAGWVYAPNGSSCTDFIP